MSETKRYAPVAIVDDDESLCLISAYDEPDAREQALRTGGVAYLRKSDPGEAVLTTLRRITSMPAPAPGTETSR